MEMVVIKTTKRGTTTATIKSSPSFQPATAGFLSVRWLTKGIPILNQHF